MNKSGASLFIDCLKAQQVEFIFTVPGASIDPLLDVLVDYGPKIILCRHEQNAAFMAQAYGRIKGKAGVCLATAGPGLTNLVTGVATAMSERSPIVAITGQLPRSMQFKQAHQNIDAVNLFKPITKWSQEVTHLGSMPDVIAGAFRLAERAKEGPTHISIPTDILSEKGAISPIPFTQTPVGGASDKALDEAANLIKKAKHPILLLGIATGKSSNAKGLRHFMEHFDAPICATFEAAGAVPRKLVDRFLGRLGVFPNQPGDRFLAKADLVMTIGFDPVEYDPSTWNRQLNRPILHIDGVPATIEQNYQPITELIGDIPSNLNKLAKLVGDKSYPLSPIAIEAKKRLDEQLERGKNIDTTPIHPLRFIYEMRHLFSDDVTVISDVGSHQYWMMRHYFCYEPSHLLTSMGFQTMGIALPYAIAITLARKGKAIAISGDGAFLMSSMELETAVRLKAPIIQVVWEDETYNLVKIQQEQKYGRHSAAQFGPIDTVLYAESMGAKGMRISSPDQIKPVLEEALAAKGPVVISLPIDYSDNAEIVETLG